MMVANAQNLIITTKPANQRNTLQRGAHQRISASTNQSDAGGSLGGRGGSSSSGNRYAVNKKSVHQESDSEEDEIVDYTRK